MTFYSKNKIHAEFELQSKSEDLDLLVFVCTCIFSIYSFWLLAHATFHPDQSDNHWLRFAGAIDADEFQMSRGSVKMSNSQGFTGGAQGSCCWVCWVGEKGQIEVLQIFLKILNLE